MVLKVLETGEQNITPQKSSHHTTSIVMLAVGDNTGFNTQTWLKHNFLQICTIKDN